MLLQLQAEGGGGDPARINEHIAAPLTEPAAAVRTS